jgi:hypothetical protein
MGLKLNKEPECCSGDKRAVEEKILEIGKNFDIVRLAGVGRSPQANRRLRRDLSAKHGRKS